MEIANSNVGQNFAQSLSEGPSVVAQERQNEAAKGKAGIAEDPKSTQALNADADNSKREGQDREIELAAQEVEAFLQVQNRNLAFSVDESTQRSVVTVKDSESGDVIRQIPSDEVLRLADRIKDLQEDIGSSVGVLFNKRV